MRVFFLSPSLFRYEFIFPRIYSHTCTTANNFPFIAQSNAFCCLLSLGFAMTRERERKWFNDYDLHLALVRQSLGREVDCLSASYSICLFTLRDTHEFIFQIIQKVREICVREMMMHERLLMILLIFVCFKAKKDSFIIVANVHM